MANVIILTFDKYDSSAGDCVENLRTIKDEDGVMFFDSVADAETWQWANDSELETYTQIVEL